jgi:hypothetical protein
MPDQAGEPAEPVLAPGGTDLEAMASRASEYVEVWERAANRMVNADYRSEDLIDDWFTCWGKWVRDSTAVTALTWKRFVAEVPNATEPRRGRDA